MNEQQAESQRVKAVAVTIPRHYLSSPTASGRQGERWRSARKILGLMRGPLPEGLTRLDQLASGGEKDG